jgi:hypothetical protein
MVPEQFGEIILIDEEEDKDEEKDEDEDGGKKGSELEEVPQNEAMVP